MGVILITAVLLWSFTIEARDFVVGQAALNLATGEVGKVMIDNKRPGFISVGYSNYKKQTGRVSVIPEEDLVAEVPALTAPFLLGNLGLRSVTIKKGDFIIGKDKNLYLVQSIFENDILEVVVTKNDWILSLKHDLDPMESLPKDSETSLLKLEDIEAVEISGCQEFCVGDYLKPLLDEPKAKSPKHSFEVIGLFSNGLSLMKYRRGKGHGVQLGGPEHYEITDVPYYISLF